jgi:hypothetical protein
MHTRYVHMIIIYPHTQFHVTKLNTALFIPTAQKTTKQDIVTAAKTIALMTFKSSAMLCLCRV